MFHVERAAVSFGQAICVHLDLSAGIDYVYSGGLWVARLSEGPTSFAWSFSKLLERCAEAGSIHPDLKCLRLQRQAIRVRSHQHG